MTKFGILGSHCHFLLTGVKKVWASLCCAGYCHLKLGRMKSVFLFLVDILQPQSHPLQTCLDSVLSFNKHKRASSWEFDARSKLLASAQLSTFGNVFDVGTHFSGTECQENT